MSTPASLEPNPPLGVRRWLISYDETGLHGVRCYGFGILWMAWQRRGAARTSRLPPGAT